MIDAAALASMRTDATLINTSRGPILNTEDLMESLRRGKLAGAAIDVFDLEPLPKDDPIVDAELIKSGKLLLTPHLGYASRQTFIPQLRQNPKFFMSYDAEIV